MPCAPAARALCDTMPELPIGGWNNSGASHHCTQKTPRAIHLEVFAHTSRSTKRNFYERAGNSPTHSMADQSILARSPSKGRSLRVQPFQYPSCLSQVTSHIVAAKSVLCLEQHLARAISLALAYQKIRKADRRA